MQGVILLKKIFAVVISLLFLLSLSSCGEEMRPPFRVVGENLLDAYETEWYSVAADTSVYHLPSGVPYCFVPSDLYVNIDPMSVSSSADAILKYEKDGAILYERCIIVKYHGIGKTRREGKSSIVYHESWGIIIYFVDHEEYVGYHSHKLSLFSDCTFCGAKYSDVNPEDFPKPSGLQDVLAQ